MNRKQLRLRHGPVVIGGVGGSGTRVIAKLVSDLGFNLGSDTNKAGDNLWFTLLFKRPGWYQKVKANEKEIECGLNLLTKAMLHSGRPSLTELRFLLTAAYDMLRIQPDHIGVGRHWQPLLHAWHLLAATFTSASQEDFLGWGWKEPNSHIFIEYIAHRFKDVKYIHTLRHGVDMAYSANQHQLHVWGGVYDVMVPPEKTLLPKASLKYWVRANQKVFDFAAQQSTENILVVNFDRLCADPNHEIEKVIAFLDVTPNIEQRRRLRQLPVTPKSAGRYQGYELKQFDADDLDAVRAFGFLL